jgi:hypothetical protein
MQLRTNGSDVHFFFAQNDLLSEILNYKISESISIEVSIGGPHTEASSKFNFESHGPFQCS